jgi:prepilin-type N-terminal cleavage/methylation domain-containing protein
MNPTKEKDDQGFTLIELLVVMIIIGILAAIAIPVFLSQRAKAQDSAAKADVSTLGKEIASYFVDNTAAPTITAGNTTGGRYGVAGTDAGKQSNGVLLIASGAAPTLTGTTSLALSSADASHWCVGVYNASGSTQFYKYSAQNGLETGKCQSAILP